MTKVKQNQHATIVGMIVFVSLMINMTVYTMNDDTVGEIEDTVGEIEDQDECDE